VEKAIIVKRSLDGRPVIRSTSPPTAALEAEAVRIDNLLHKRIAALEKELVVANLLEKTIPDKGGIKAGGDVKLWHTIGSVLRELVEETGLSGPRERRWLWEAIENLHATERIKRARRGKSRIHFEYCFRLSALPLDFAEQINWSEWVTYFDSRSVREDERSDKWLQKMVQRKEKIDRKKFRSFTVELNSRLKNLDTSVLSEAELDAMYSAAWEHKGGSLKVERGRQRT